MSNTKDDGTLRSFDTGATRDTSKGKLAYNGFLSPFVLRQFARYMNMNRVQSDGKLRDPNNWQKGIPVEAYRESLSRHYQEFWEEVEKVDKIGPMGKPRESDIRLMSAASGMLFNVMGYMLEWLKENDEVRFDDDEPTTEMQERLDNIKHETGVTHGIEDCREEQCDGTCALRNPKEVFDKAHEMDEDSEIRDEHFAEAVRVGDVEYKLMLLKNQVEKTKAMIEDGPSVTVEQYGASMIPATPEEICERCLAIPEDGERCVCETEEEDCTKCRWEDVELDQEPCRACLLKNRLTYVPYSLWMAKKQS